MTHLTAGQQVATVYRSAKGVFTSDGCTSAPDFTFRACCEQHDRDYFDHTVTRRDADDALRACMQTQGYVILPWVYWLAVRALGRGFWYGNNPQKAGI